MIHHPTSHIRLFGNRIFVGKKNRSGTWVFSGLVTNAMTLNPKLIFDLNSCSYIVLPNEIGACAAADNSPLIQNSWWPVLGSLTYFFEILLMKESLLESVNDDWDFAEKPGSITEVLQHKSRSKSIVRMLQQAAEYGWAEKCNECYDRSWLEYSEDTRECRACKLTGNPYLSPTFSSSRSFSNHLSLL